MPSNGSRHEDDAIGPPRPDAAERSAPRIRDLRAGREEGSAEELRVLPNPFGEASGDGEGSDGPSAQGDLAAITDERDELLDSLRRMQADFENYKKRVERQSAEVRDRANERIVESLLPALDAFAMARSHIGEAEAGPEAKALLQAAALFEDALAKEGLERIDAKGVAFDPNSHEAVEHRDASDDEPDATSGAGGSEDGAAGVETGPVIDEIYRPGYIWKGRVLRPAMVRVRG
jgi:molecular chaperone GrpE